MYDRGMLPVRFEGALGDVLDGTSKITVRPRCTGEANVVARDAEHFAAAIPEMGGEAQVTVWVQGTVMQHLRRALHLLAAERGLALAMNETAALFGAATPPIDEELGQIGARIELVSIAIALSPEDTDALRAATAAVIRTKAEDRMRPAFPTMFVPGARVLGRWTDGRERPATVLCFNGTHYEVVWDGATESTFLTPEHVRVFG